MKRKEYNIYELKELVNKNDDDEINKILSFYNSRVRIYLKQYENRKIIKKTKEEYQKKYQKEYREKNKEHIKELKKINYLKKKNLKSE